MADLSANERLKRGAMIRLLLSRLKERSPDEARHAERVAVYAVATGSRLGLSGDALLDLRYGASLHDIGKVTWPDRLFKIGSVLSEADKSLIWGHPLAGAVSLTSQSWLKGALAGIVSHHERWDGSGYPLGLVGEEIPLMGRIVAVSEVFDCLTMPSGWREPIREKEAIQVVTELSGTWFDPVVVEGFLEIQLIVQPLGL